MHDDVTTYCTPQKKDANWSWGSDQTFLGLEPEPGGYGHWVVCMPCAQMLVSPLCDTCPGICLERSLRLKVSVEVTSGARAGGGQCPLGHGGHGRAIQGERSRACGAEGPSLRWSTRKRMLLTLLASEDSAPLPGLLGALSEAHRPGWYECIVGSRSEDLDARGELSASGGRHTLAESRFGKTVVGRVRLYRPSGDSTIRESRWAT